MPHLQLKDVPQGLHDALRARAVADGVSMREYVLRLVEADLGRPATWDETLRLLGSLPAPPSGAPRGADLVRTGREERDARRPS
jgi:antitoxin FitA